MFAGIATISRWAVGTVGGIYRATRPVIEIAVTTFGGEEVAGKSDLSRLWERVESIREDLGSLADEIAELYGAEEGDDLEAVLGRSEPCSTCLRIMQGGRL